MTRLQGRLRKVKATLTDHTGLVPNSPKWFEYWTRQLGRALAGEEIPEKVPLAFIDALREQRQHS